MEPASWFAVMIALRASAVRGATATEPQPPAIGIVVATKFPAFTTEAYLLFLTG
jgi:hypothetical protein